MNVKLSEKDIVKHKLVLPLLLFLISVLAFSYIHWLVVNRFIKEYDNNRLELTYSIDQNIVTHLERSRSSMEHVTGRKAFTKAEKEWRNNGNSYSLQLRMGEYLALQEKLIKVILAEQDGEIVLSTDGNLDYSLLCSTNRKDVAYYTTTDNQIYMGMILEKSGGLRYIALLNSQTLYQSTRESEKTDGSYILFYDEHSKIIISSNENHVQLMKQEEHQKINHLSIDFLKECQNKDKIGVISFLHTSNNDRSFKARMTTLPTSESKNGIIAIGVVDNFENIIFPLSSSDAKVVLYNCGVFLVVLCLIYHLQISGLRHKKELELLRQKNEAMKELNRQTAELAHHQRLELVGTLTAGVAHEFNNLLTPIMGYSIMALENIPEENIKATDQILQIYESSRKAKEITRRLSDISRKNNRKLMTCLNVESLLQKTLEMAQPSRPPFVEVVCEHPEKEIHVFGDETQLIQMFLNLVINAFHAMIPNGGTLSIGIEESDGNAKITVKDAGCGIAADMIPNIFNPFFTTKENGTGTGLGLAIVQQVISEHHGEIKVESEPDVGSSFIVFLPLYEAELRTGEDLTASHDENEV